jgi:transposase-like protein
LYNVRRSSRVVDNGDTVEVQNDEQSTGGEKALHYMQSSNGTISTEVKATTSTQKPQRRRFSATDKLRIVREADALAVGTMGAFLRREGIYSSQLYAWRRQRDQGELDPGAARQRAKTKMQVDEAARRLKELERENRKLRRRLDRAELINEIQKKFAGLLGIDLESPETNESAE